MDADRVESLEQAERRLQAAQLASDVTALGELLDEDAIFTGPDGNLYTREDDLRVHGTGHQVMTRVDEEELRISTFGDDVGVTFFLGTLEGTVGGDPIKARMRYTRTWKHDNTRWRIIAAHASFLTEEAQSG
ncbi:nuclear transport factor 2 family protein [Mycobacterium sp. AZCC_0083]|uniref:nuclear transport factor 2 family protein n=1 Tax=Mycobacterium sp. AZCC_0083 TaxID=2735882 RepID=UPI0016108A49|nr:nuclear transport factor 2 family protein [Mycobacterium sp. AZCC_0083]MBB5161168.1 ketosteroid isomerase-like protein [Mycobacterium sp. AZCC_0083]